MSVVNDMLRDLDKRQAPERSGAPNSAATRESMIEPYQPTLVKRLALPIACIVCLLAGVAWYFFNSESITQEQNLVVAQEVGLTGNGVEENDITDLEAQTSAVSNAISLHESGSEDANAHVEKVQSSTQPSPVHELTEVTESSNEKPLKSTQTDRITRAATPKAAQSQVISTSSIKTSLNTPKKKENNKATQSSKAKLITTKSDAPKKDKTEKPKTSAKSSTPVLANAKASGNTLNDGANAQDSKQLNAGVKLSRQAEDERMAAQGLSLLENGQPERAIELLKAFVEGSSISANSQSLLAQIYLNRGQVDEFEKLLATAARPLDFRLVQMKARHLSSEKQYDQAIALLNSNAPDIAQSPDHFALLASLYQKSGQPEKAFQIYSDLIQFNDQIADWWAGLGLTVDQMKQTRQARMAYQQALSMNGLNSTLRTYITQRLAAL